MAFNVLKDINIEVQKRYHLNDFNVEIKSDNSPVTSIDLWVHKRLEACLLDYDRNIPVISEESVSSHTGERVLERRFWLIDPIDGTQEMIKKTGEFCICVALIEDFKARLGFIATPLTGDVFFGDSHEMQFGSMSKQGFQWHQSLQSREDIIVLESRFFSNRDVEKIYAKLESQIAPKKLQRRVVGAAIKFVYVALGKADGFVKTNETYAWDSAAGVAIIHAAGGYASLLNGDEIVYNQLKHPGFLVESKQRLLSQSIYS